MFSIFLSCSFTDFLFFLKLRQASFLLYFLRSSDTCWFCVRLRRYIPVFFLSTDTIFAPQTAQVSCNPFALISITRIAGLPRFVGEVFPDSGAQMKGAVMPEIFFTVFFHKIRHIWEMRSYSTPSCALQYSTISRLTWWA